MTLLRNILSDLVEKRLWPLAIVLVAALFVAPSVVSKPVKRESKLPCKWRTIIAIELAAAAGTVLSASSESCASVWLPSFLYLANSAL